MDDAAEMTEEQPGGRLVPLPRRRLGDDDAGEILATSPTASVADLLERTDHLLGQLEEDVAGLRKDQDKERRRIEQDAEDRQEAADAAMDRLRKLELRAREIAERKARTDVLDAALASNVELDKTVPFDELVRKIEEEIKLAKGITGAIRLTTIADLLKQATLRVEYMNRQAEKSRERLLKQTEVDLHAEGKEARASYEIGMSVVRRDLKALDLALPPAGLPWTDKRWEHWEGWDPLGGASRWVRFGECYRRQLEKFRFPALLEIPGGRGVVFDVGNRREEAIDAMRSIVLRLLASIPAGSALFTFIDPDSLGESVAPFLPLGEYRRDLIGDRVGTFDDQIVEQLTEITHHMERVIQQYLRGDYQTIDEHNDAVGEIAEPYRFVVVFDFPNQLTTHARQLLRNIIDNGPRCGVYTLMTTAPGAARANRSKWNAMISGLDLVRADNDGFFIETDEAGTWTVALDAPPELNVAGEDGSGLFAKILTTTGEQAKQGQSVEAGQSRVFSLLAAGARLPTRDDFPDWSTPVDADDPATWWTGDSTRGLSVPLGRAGGRDVVTLWLDSGLHSGAVIGGQPGSGKSAVLRDAIVGLSMIYPPDELELYLIDFEDYGEFEAEAAEQLPHARLVATESDREFGVSVLDGIVDEIDRRALIFRPIGGERAGISGYRELTGGTLPRIVVVIDALDKLFEGDDRAGDRAAQLLDAIARRGGSYGVHLLVASQTVGRLQGIGRHTIDLLRVRVALPASDDESVAILGEGNFGAAELERAGQAVMNMNGAGADENRPFQVTWIDDHERDVCLRDLRRLADERGFARTPQVYEGSAPARLEDSTIAGLAAAMSDDGAARARRKPRIWLGEPATLGGPVELLLKRQSGANLLIVGANDRLGQGLLLAALTSAALVHGNEFEARVIDFMPLETGFAEAAGALARHWPVQVARRRNLIDTLGGVHDEISKRYANDDYTAPPLLFIVNGIGQARELDPAESPDTESVEGELSPGRAIETIAREGPEVGVHTIITSDTVHALGRRLSRATLREFALRIAMHMGAEESATLIDSAYAGTLKAHQAVLYDEDAGRLTKFRPYVVPSPEFLETLAK